VVRRGFERCVPPVAEQVYPLGVIKRTNINLDVELVAAAAEQLGTRGNTDTVHAAMRDVVARARRRALAERDFTDLTPEALAELRAPRAG
jgi:Arc/MetJ family transcription regulator